VKGLNVSSDVFGDVTGCVTCLIGSALTLSQGRHAEASMVDAFRERHASVMSCCVTGSRPLLDGLHSEFDSALARGLRDEWCRQVLNFFAAAFWTRRMRGRMLADMFGVLELFAARFAAVFVGRHGKPPAGSDAGRGEAEKTRDMRGVCDRCGVRTASGA
jgi:hypothetical protein